MAAAPRVDATWLVQQGNKAYELALAHRVKIEPRLQPGLLDGLRDDIDELPEHEVRARSTRQTSRVATAAQNSVLRQAFDIVSALGAMLRRKGREVPAEVRKAYGVGVRIDPKSVPSVLSAGAVLVQRATANPEEARALGVLDSDIETLRELLTALGAADRAQEGMLAARPKTTRQKNAAARRVLSGIQAIAGAGVAAFALEPELRAQFDALDDQPKQKKKKR